MSLFEPFNDTCMYSQANCTAYAFQAMCRLPAVTELKVITKVINIYQ